MTEIVRLIEIDRERERERTREREIDCESLAEGGARRQWMERERDRSVRLGIEAGNAGKGNG